MKNFSETEERDTQSLIKTGNAFRFINPLQESKAYTTEENGETNYFVELFASSDQEDLVGDVMEQSALEEMRDSAPGTIMLRDHNPSTDKIFGSITEAELIKRDGKTLLWIKAEIDAEDKQNIRIWKSIKKGVKLGASVTVVIVDSKPNPHRRNGLIIVSIKLLEISIVTIPCNQDSWTLAAKARKALNILESRFLRPEQNGKNFAADAGTPETAINTLEGKQMSQENETPKTAEKNVATETVIETSVEPVKEETETGLITPAETATEETIIEALVKETETVETENTAPAEKSYFPRTMAAITAAKAVRQQIDSGEIVELQAVAVKGLFNEILAQEPNLWELYDILCEVKWNLMSQKWNLEYLGQTDFSEILNSWDEALDEFKAAAKVSFQYWGNFPDSESETETVLSNAAAIEKAFKDLSELIERSSGETAQSDLRRIGASIYGVAKQAGIVFPFAEVSLPGDNLPVIADDAVRNSKIFTETQTRAENAETELGKVRKQLETAKAGLELANTLLEKVAKQPLEIAEPAQN